jgi:hypothetical protein
VALGDPELIDWIDILFGPDEFREGFSEVLVSLLSCLEGTRDKAYSLNKEPPRLLHLSVPRRGFAEILITKVLPESSEEELHLRFDDLVINLTQEFKLSLHNLICKRDYC